MKHLGYVLYQNRLLILTILVSFVLPLILGNELAYAKILKWVDENGVTQYGDHIPTPYTQKSRAEINKQGILIKYSNKINSDGQASDSSTIQEKSSLSTKDKILLGSYTTADEIDLARDRDLKQIDMLIQSLETQTANTQARLDVNLKMNGYLMGHGKPIPNSLTLEIANNKADIAEYNAKIALKKQALEKIRTQYDTDKARFMSLKNSNTTPLPMLK